MTQTTLIIVNAILGAAVTYAVICLLLAGIGSDRGVRGQVVGQLRQTNYDRRAA